MAVVCFDCSVFEDLRLRALPAALRAAFPVLVARMAAYGDGVLTDRELGVGLLGPKRFGELAEALIGWGWLLRDAEGRLGRGAGFYPQMGQMDADRDELSPQSPRGHPQITQMGCDGEGGEGGEEVGDDGEFGDMRDGEDFSLSPTPLVPGLDGREAGGVGRVDRVDAGRSEEGDALAGRLDRFLARVAADGGRKEAEGLSPQMTQDGYPQISQMGCNGEEAGMIGARRFDGAGLACAGDARASESESDSDSDRTRTLLRESDPSRIGSDRTRTRAWKTMPQRAAPHTPLFDALRGEGYAEDILAETARRVGEENFWKAKYVRTVARNLVRERVG